MSQSGQELRHARHSGFLEKNFFSDSNTNRTHDLLQSLIARRGITFGLVSLNLLLFEAKALGECLLAESRGDSGLDEPNGQFIEGVNGDCCNVATLERFLYLRFGAEVLQLALKALTLGLNQTRMNIRPTCRLGLHACKRLLELLSLRLGDSVPAVRL